MSCEASKGRPWVSDVMTRSKLVIGFVVCVRVSVGFLLASEAQGNAYVCSIVSVNPPLHHLLSEPASSAHRVDMACAMWPRSHLCRIPPLPKACVCESDMLACGDGK